MHTGNTHDKESDLIKNKIIVTKEGHTSATPDASLLYFLDRGRRPNAPKQRSQQRRTTTSSQGPDCRPAAAGALIISHATMPNWSHALMTGSFLRNMASMMRMESLMSVSRHTEKSTAFLLMV